MRIILFLSGLLLLISCKTEEVTTSENWYFQNFTRAQTNPVLEPQLDSYFNCPIRKDSVLWEYKDVFNPAAIIKDNLIHLLYRAEDTVGRYHGTSRIGLAISRDGVTFQRNDTPVLYPENDFMKRYEWEGGVEDPRVVVNEDGEYVMTYTAYDGQTARLCVAVSEDLIEWEKKGLAFKSRRYRNLWSKSGSVVSRLNSEGNPEAVKVNGKYWMYWGDTNMFIASSDNLFDWTPVTNSDGELTVVFKPRNEYFDSRLIEPGPPALVTEKGILLIYNGMNLDSLGRDENLAPGTYSTGQALLSKESPAQLLDRTPGYFLTPVNDFEITGQIGNVCFVEAFVRFNDKFFLYYGTADSKIAVVTSTEMIEF